jgi:citronellol/citronellal dehydrogenase
MMRASRRPEILADAACRIFQKPARAFTGNFLIDDSFLVSEGMTDLDRYRVDPSVPLQPDFFVPEDCVPPVPLASAARG